MYDLPETGIADGWEDMRWKEIEGLRRLELTCRAGGEYVGVDGNGDVLEPMKFRHFMVFDLDSKDWMLMARTSQTFGY